MKVINVYWTKNLNRQGRAQKHTLHYNKNQFQIEKDKDILLTSMSFKTITVSMVHNWLNCTNRGIGVGKKQ